MEFDSPAQLEGIGEDGIIIGTDVSQQGKKVTYGSITECI